jgi:ATP-dependent DNA helicase DinG
MSCGQLMQPQSDDFLLHGALGREIRPGQVQMGRLIEEAIQKKAVAFIEGPVGIGKSFGYCVPAILANKRVVISTAKKQLQHQLRDDLPKLVAKLGRPHYTVALLKGKSNYACRYKATDLVARDGYKKFVEWLEKSEYGDIADYPGRPPPFWYEATAEDCIGKRCPWAERGCGYWKAKQQTKTAHIIIANHHVVAFDLKFGPQRILGKYDVLVIDEAHQAEKAFQGAYSVSLGSQYVKRLIKAGDRAGVHFNAKGLEDAWTAAFERIRDLEGEIARDPFGSTHDDLAAQVADYEELVATTLKDDFGMRRSGDSEDAESTVPTDSEELKRMFTLESLGGSLAQTRLTLRDLKEPGDNKVIYIPPSSERKYKTVTVAPISVGPMIGPKLRTLSTVVVTSATIAVGDSFSDIKRRLGLEDPSTPWEGYVKPLEAILETPFDYNRQALLYMPRDLPLPVSGGHPDKSKYYDQLESKILKLVRASDGNAFVLFSSKEDMKEIHARLLEEDLDNPIVLQGEDAESTLKEFKNTPRSFLLGVKSFWEGVNIEGDKLRLVIITKLPFPMPSEPVYAAQVRQYVQQQVARGVPQDVAEKQVFNIFAVPAMLTDLRQGAGRLIRTKTDRGVLAILDPRVYTGSSKKLPTATQSHWGYGAAVVKALGYGQRTDDFNLVERYLAMLRRQEETRENSKAGNS